MVRAVFDGIEPFSDYSERILSSDTHSLTLWTFEDGDGSVVGYNFVYERDNARRNRVARAPTMDTSRRACDPAGRGAPTHTRE